MRKILLSLLLINGLAIRPHAQSMSINTDGSIPDASSILDIKSSAKGLLIPRMNSAQRSAIATPATGLMVFDTTSKTLFYFNGTSWANISAGWSLGGNGGTNSTTQFIGTTDNAPLVIKVNNELAGLVGSTAASNTTWGYRALKNNNGGTENVALGYLAMASNVTGMANTAMGTGSMYYNTSGYYNSATGYQSLANNTTGSTNTADGASALFHNTTGSNNTATGSFALTANTTGVANTANGSFSLITNTTGINNTANGVNALYSNVTGSNNVAVGANSSYSNTTGGDNTAIGSQAMTYNTSGISNTATGARAMITNTTGSRNTANGLNAMYANNTGADNTATGFQSLASNTEGTWNTAAGANALFNNTTGFFNTAIGYQSINSITTGSYNTAIGAFCNVGANNLSNSTAIGYNTVVDASNKVRIGNTAVTVIEGQVSFTTPSDGRFKYNIREDVRGLDFILQLRPVTYQFDVKRFDAQLHSSQKEYKPDNTMQASLDKASAIRRTGFIAQEVEQAAIKTGYDFSGIVKPQSENDHYSLSYESFVVPLVKAVQEQEKVIDDLKKEIVNQSAANNALLKRIEALEKK